MEVCGLRSSPSAAELATGDQHVVISFVEASGLPNYTLQMHIDT